MLLLTLILAPFLGSLAAALLPANARNSEAWLAGLVGVIGLGITLSLLPAISNGEVVRFTAEWLPGQDLNFILRMDGLAWLFSVLIQGICLLVVLYVALHMIWDGARSVVVRTAPSVSRCVAEYVFAYALGRGPRSSSDFDDFILDEVETELVDYLMVFFVDFEFFSEE